MAAEERFSRLDSQVSMDAAPLEIDPMVQESGQTPVDDGNEVLAEIGGDVSNFEPLMNESSSLFLSDSCSSFEDGTWLRELEKYKNLMPPEIRIEYYDALVLYSEENKSDARKFCDHLKNDINLKGNEFVKAVLYDELVPQAGSKLKLLQIALERCTYIFCYITKEFCEDKWIELSREECLMEALENEEKRWCVIPVNTVPYKTADFKIPFGLMSIRGISYYQNNKYYRALVSGLIQNKLFQRLDKEKKQKQKQFTWLQNYKRALPVGKVNISCLENKEQEKQKITEKAVNEGFNHPQPMLLQKTGMQTSTDPHEQTNNTASERRSSDKGDHRGQSGKSISQENDPSYNNSIESTYQLSQEGCTSHMEPVSHKFSTSGNLSDIPLLDGQDSTLVSNSINSYTGEKKPVQEESATGTTIDESGLQDMGALSLNPSEDGMSLTSDQSQDSLMTPDNQSPSCWVPSVSQSPCIQETLVSQSEKSDTTCTLLHTSHDMPFVQVARRPAAPLLNRPSPSAAKTTPLVQSDSTSAQPIPPGEDPLYKDELD